MTVTDIAQTIGAITTALVTVIAAIAAIAAAVVSIRTGRAVTGQDHKLDAQSQALDKIDHQTNATLSELRDDIRRQGAEIQSLNDRLLNMIAQKGPETLPTRPPDVP